MVRYTFNQIITFDNKKTGTQVPVFLCPFLYQPHLLTSRREQEILVAVKVSLWL